MSSPRRDHRPLGCGRSPEQGAAPPELERYTFGNGITVILRRGARLPIAAVNVWYHVGPGNETPGCTGFAHLFEHMMFEGSGHIPRGVADARLGGVFVAAPNRL
ncbi:insulinase family protein [Pseudonocardia spinosispora]|uniref:insulinase family protein n=1 Tax=Pseudonocardia spinosispora TaxID=103441 RepID=UPI001B7F84F0